MTLYYKGIGGAFDLLKFSKLEELWFGLPDFFQQKLTKDEFEVQFKFTQVFSSINIVKEFFIQEFLDSYPSVLSNQRRTKIKKLFIQSVKLFQQYDLIEPDYKIISDGYYCSVELVLLFFRKATLDLLKP